MPIAYIENVSAGGVARDTKPHDMPIELWSDGKNIRFSDACVEKVKGYATLLGTPPVAPHFLLAVATELTFFWLYAGLTKVYALENSTHNNITRQTTGVDVDYLATAELGWTGGMLGGVPFLNNSIDPPQVWDPVSIGTRLSALANWPASTTCASLRTFKQFLIALDVVKSGARYPQMIKWSHPADPGFVPSTWDETDPTHDAGEYSLLETSGYVIDCLPLRDVNVIYKEDSVWAMQYVGGEYIFRFYQLFKTFGMIAKNCAVEWDSRHYVFTGSDVIVHDGQTSRSIVDKRFKKWIRENIDGDNYKTSFVFALPSRGEIWVCFPTVGYTYPNVALVIKADDGVISLCDLPSITGAGFGAVTPTGVSDYWDDASGVWDTDTEVWGQRLYNAANPKLVTCSPLNTKIYVMEYAELADGQVMPSYVERLGIGTIPEHFDTTVLKLFKALIPRIEGTIGGVLTITAFTQMEAGGAITQLTPQTFIIGTTSKVNAFGTGRFLGFRIASESNVTWSLHGYGIEYELAGVY